MTTVTLDTAEAPLVLALDIGTSSIRSLVFDSLGQTLVGSEARRSYEITVSQDGASEANPDRMLALLWECIDDSLTAVGKLGEQIAAVAICTLVSNVLGIDTANRAVTPLTTYADTRAAAAAEELREELDEEVVHQRTGCRLHPSYLPARFRWLQKEHPDLMQRVSRWISIGEYLQLKLFGEAAASHSVASWTGLLNRNTLAWDKQLLSALSIEEESLSTLTDLQTAQQGLRAEFARRWPPLRSVPWFPAVGDGAAANIGSGCVTAERVALTVGTSSALRAVVEGPVEHIPAGLWCYRVDRRRALPGGALSAGGNLFAWLDSVARLPDREQAEREIAARPPDCHGLTFLPFLTGERSPGWAGHARAAIDGLSLATSGLDLYQAAMEALCYRIALVFDILADILPGEPEIVASGGVAVNSGLWPQMMADVLGRPLSLSTAPEASARGAALLALEALGHTSDLGMLPHPVDRVCQPQPERHHLYRVALERQQELYRRLVTPYNPERA